MPRYARDIAGIGRDDNSALSQTKSKSVNSNKGFDHHLPISDFTTPTTFASNGIFWSGAITVSPPLPIPITASITMAAQLRCATDGKRTWSFQNRNTFLAIWWWRLTWARVIGPSGFGTNNTGNDGLLIDGDATFGNALLAVDCKFKQRKRQYDLLYGLRIRQSQLGPKLL